MLLVCPPSDEVSVITACPSPTAVTRPLSSTVATAPSELSKDMRWSLASIGITAYFSWEVLFRGSSSWSSSKCTSWIGMDNTVTRQVALAFSPEKAITSHDPGATAMTTPSCVTRATPWSVDTQRMNARAPSGCSLAVSCEMSLERIVSSAWLTESAVSSGAPSTGSRTERWYAPVKSPLALTRRA